MEAKISIVYSWFVRTMTYFLPNIPVFMRFRGFLYSLMMEKCGKDFQVASSATLGTLSGLKIGNHVYIAHNVVVLGMDIELKNEVLIGPNCVIASGNHRRVRSSFRFGGYYKGTVSIGNGCWVAANCSILSGSGLPDGSILAAGSVLNRIFNDKNHLYGGTPAVKIKEIFD